MLDLTKPYVVNAGLVPKQVGIIRISDGAKGSMRVMGRGKVNIPDGFKKDGNWLALNGDKLSIVEPSVAPKQNVPVVTQTSAPEAPVAEEAASEETPASTVQAEESTEASATPEVTKGE